MNFRLKSLLFELFLTTYMCFPAVAANSPVQHFHPADSVYSATLPQSWTIHTDYTFNGLGSGRPLPGVLFSIPHSETAGTNLSPRGTGVAIVSLPGQQTCRARDYLASARVGVELSEGGTQWSLAHSIDVGAGTKSTTQIFARRMDGTCILVLYLVRTRDLTTLPPGSVHAYDRFALLAAFDQIRHDLVATSVAKHKSGAQDTVAARQMPARRR